MTVTDFKGKTAVVTGGASGIGLATVERLASEGCSVVIVDLNDEAGEKAAADVGGAFVRADVSDPAGWDRIVSTAKKAYGGIDIAYLNAGVTTGEGDIVNLTDQQYRRIVGANIDGVVFGVRAVTPAIQERGGGAIVATASLAGVIAFSPDPIYTLTKHAVVGFVRSVAMSLTARNITINAICPGVVDTPLVGEAREMLQQAGFAMIPPAEIADAVVNAITSGETGLAWSCRVGRPPEPVEFPQVDVL